MNHDCPDKSPEQKVLSRADKIELVRARFDLFRAEQQEVEREPRQERDHKQDVVSRDEQRRRPDHHRPRLKR